MNDTPQQPPQEPGETSGSTPEPSPPEPPSPGPPTPPPVYTPPPLPPGYEAHYRPIYTHAQPPGNSNAVASIIMACGSLGLLFLTAGIAAPICLIVSAIAIPLGHKGKEDVDRGKTTQNRDLALAGFWTGIGGVILSVLAIIAWVILIAVIANNGVHWTDSNGNMHHFNMN